MKKKEINKKYSRELGNKTITQISDYIKENTDGDIFAILNFDYVEPFNENMKGDAIK